MAQLVWRVSRDRFRELHRLLSEAQHAEEMGRTLRLEELSERIQRIPGYPKKFNPREDHVVIVEEPSTISMPSTPNRDDQLFRMANLLAKKTLNLPN